MSARFPGSQSSKTTEGDERMSALLHEWRAIEPRDNFEAAVWRRVRTASLPEPVGASVSGILRDWLLPRTVWVSAVAAAAAILVGTWAGLSVPAAGIGGRAVEPLLHPQTLAGSYLTMVTGGAR